MIRYESIFGGTDQSLTNLVLQFKKAKVDKRIKAIMLDVDMSGAGWGKAEEIRDAITDFRSSGKPVYAYMEYRHEQGVLHRQLPATKFISPPPGELSLTVLPQT